MSRNTMCWTFGALAALALVAQSSVLAESSSLRTTSGAQAKVQETSFDYFSTSKSLSSCDTGCDVAPTCGCGNSACDGGCGRCRNWFAGVEATFLAIDDSGSSVTASVTDAAGPTTNNYTTEGLDSLYTGARVWLGVQGDCYGLVGRFWNMDASEATITPFGAGGPGFYGFERMENTTFDLEVTRQFTRRCTDLTASFGARYAEWDHTGIVNPTEAVGADLTSVTGVFSQRFEGVGLTGGLMGVRPVGCGNWSLFWTARLSVLWGDTEHLVETIASVQGAGGSAASINGAAAQNDDDLFIGEFQIGLQRDFALQCIPANAFIRGAFEYQYWDASNGSALSTSTAASAAGGSTVTVDSGGLRADLYGFTVGAGISW